MTALLYVDQQPIEIGELPLDEALAQLQGYLGEQGRLIGRVAVNGEEVMGDWQAALADVDVHDLALTTVSVDELIHNTMHETAATLPMLIQSIERAALAFRTGDDHSGFVALTELLEGLQSYLIFLNSVLPYVPQSVTEIEAQINGLGEWLSALMAAWKQEDYVLVADYLLYEIVPQIEAGQRWLQTQIG